MCYGIYVVYYVHTRYIWVHRMFVSPSPSTSCLKFTSLICVCPISPPAVKPYRVYVCTYVVATSPLCLMPPSYPYPTGDGHSTFVRSLADRVLSVDLFLKPKYIFSGILADHISMGTMLQVRPHLPLEIMDAMSYQNLAPHVSRKHGMHTQQYLLSHNCTVSITLYCTHTH